jgi:NAD-dependent dihydropyrimidine dehydrogenase PreA subunit
VFEVVRTPDDQFAQMSLLVKFKLFVRGWKTAITPRVYACSGCGLWVDTCPENAIKLDHIDP